MLRSSQRYSLTIYCFALIAAAMALYAFWPYQGRAVVLPEIAGADHKMQCVSYSPFAKDQSPLDPNFTIRPERMDADLALLAKYFSCVRTYSMTGLERLPEFAQKYGLKVMLGAWVSPNPKTTRLEIEQLIATANRYPEVVKAVIVGNEALLRKDISGPRLAELITEVKSRVKQPVTYADVWEFWLKHPQVAPVVDFITIHLLPYWEDQPTSGEGALTHVAEVHDEFERRFAPKDILIGEVGWPSEGRQRETALPSRVEQAKFMRGFIAMAEHNGWEYNVIEAFDQPWKRNNEGAVGGYWGLFDADRHDKHALAGAVSNMPDWQRWQILAAVIALVTLVVVGLPATREAALVVPVLAVLGGSCIALWWQQAAYANRDHWEWLWTLLLTAINLLVVWRAGLALASAASWRGRVFLRCERWAGKLLLLTGFIAAVLMLQLVFDARYRQFPSEILLLPALVFMRWPTAARRRETVLLMVVIALGIPIQLWQETLQNTQAIGWSLVSAALVYSLSRSLRTKRSAAISSANTASVTV